MTGFKSLTKALEDLFDRPLAELPDGLRGQVVDMLKFVPTKHPQWDALSVKQRRSATFQSDFSNDPECNAGRERLFQLFCEIEETKKAKTPTVLDIETRDRRIAEREKEIAVLDASLQQEAITRWGLWQKFPTTRPSNTIRGERICQRELEALMRQFDAPPKLKEMYRAEQRAKHNISVRAFDRAWANAIAATGNTRWRRAGRPTVNPRT